MLSAYDVSNPFACNHSSFLHIMNLMAQPISRLISQQIRQFTGLTLVKFKTRRVSNGPPSATLADSMPYGKRPSRREQRKVDKVKTQSERLIQMKLPTALAVTEKKERLLTRDLNETLRHVALLTYREKRMVELTTLINYTDDPDMKAMLKAQLFDVLKVAAPTQKETMPSGEIVPLLVLGT